MNTTPRIGILLLTLAAAAAGPAMAQQGPPAKALVLAARLSPPQLGFRPRQPLLLAGPQGRMHCLQFALQASLGLAVLVPSLRRAPDAAPS